MNILCIHNLKLTLNLSRTLEICGLIIFMTNAIKYVILTLYSNVKYTMPLKYSFKSC